MKQIKVDVAKCTGCGQCALTCSFKNVGKFELNQSNIRIIQWEDICLSVPKLCQQCSDTPCVVVCPTEAISVNPATGAIVIDNELCIQCNLCVDECRYHVIHIDLEGYPLTCDLCGGSPKCVTVCFPGALSFEEIPDAEKEPFKALAKILIDRGEGKPVLPPEELASRSVT
ncbi:MAG: 4Fe-4S dicluster domain-containing protein [Chloroflexi bacterium]|nr:MAG: 4Fe-4S dicluster domain-containing protein [Chloroflexota bacterium]